MSERMIIGAMQFPDEPEPEALVLIDCPDAKQGLAMAKFVRGLQNGTAPLARVSPNAFFGDTVLKLSLELVPGDPERVIATLWAERSPKDATLALWLQTEISRETAEDFRYVHRLHRTYAASVSINGVPLFAEVHMMKYLCDYPWKARRLGPEREEELPREMKQIRAGE